MLGLDTHTNGAPAERLMKGVVDRHLCGFELCSCTDSVAEAIRGLNVDDVINHLGIEGCPSFAWGDQGVGLNSRRCT